VEQVLRQLHEHPARHWHVVWGMVNDKVRADILALLPPAASYYWVCPSVPRGLDAAILAQEGAELGLSGQAYGQVMAGLEAARAAAKPDDLIYVGGSTFVVADLLAAYPGVSAMG
jgi:dihydrofolate synthase/folylpolyglutamate synthase